MVINRAKSDAFSSINFKGVKTDTQTDRIAPYSLDQPALPASPGRGPPSVMSGLSISVQPTAPASSIELLSEQ